MVGAGFDEEHSVVCAGEICSERAATGTGANDHILILLRLSNCTCICESESEECRCDFHGEYVRERCTN